MKIKRNVAFKLRAYGKDKSLFQIRLRATFNGQRIDFKTGCQLNDKSAWDEGSQLVKDGYKGPKGETALSINTELRNIKDQMESSFMFYEATDKIPTVSELQKTYEDRLKGTIPKRPDPEPKKERKPRNPDFFATFEKFVKEGGEKNAWTEGTFEKWASLKRDLQAFKSNIKFSDLTEPTLTEFVAYLRDNTNLTYKTFKPTLKMTQKKVIYLTKEEMTRIRNLELTGEKAYLDPIRDIFLFCCFSGLRHSDVNNLRRSDIKGDHIEVTTVKTADSISIELNKVTKAILEKYKDTPFKDGKVLPNYTNQAMNRDIKELCKLAGINEEIRVTTYKGNVRTDKIQPKWELVGTHTGRRTFIVNALSLGITPNIVMKWTGHSDYKAMKPYIDIVDSIKASSMTKFNDLL